MDNSLLNKDDAFLLGNVCGAAIVAGMGSDVRSIFRCLQHERPDNAGGFILEAMALQQEERINEALELMVENRALEKSENREEAISLYALLLVQAGDIKGGYKIAKAAMDTDCIVSESARAALGRIVSEVESKETIQ